MRSKSSPVLWKMGDLSSWYAPQFYLIHLSFPGDGKEQELPTLGKGFFLHTSTTPLRSVCSRFGYGLLGPIDKKIIPRAGYKFGDRVTMGSNPQHYSSWDKFIFWTGICWIFLKTSELAQPFKDISVIHSQTGKKTKPHIKMKPRLRTWILIQRIKRPMWSYLNTSIANPSQDYTHNKSKCTKEKKRMAKPPRQH